MKRRGPELRNGQTRTGTKSAHLQRPQSVGRPGPTGPEPLNPSLAELRADRARALALTPVAPAVAARLDGLVERLLEAQQTTNLIGDKTIHSLWTRHVADSLQLLPLAPDAKVWVDLGTGAGFPGLVVACALKDTPGAVVHLVEGTQKKARFLEEVARALALPVLVHPVRIEQFMNEFRGGAQVVTARALAPLSKLLDYGEKLLKTGTLGLFPKGQHVEAELTEASKCWSIDYDLVPSRTSGEGRILVVRGMRKRAKSPARNRFGGATRRDDHE